MNNRRLLALTLLLLSTAWAQPSAAQSGTDQEKINFIFDRMEAQGVDTRQKLLYGYFFKDSDSTKLASFKSTLLPQAYRFVALRRVEGKEFMLHMEKLETHTRQRLLQREQQLRTLAANHSIASFDGFDVGNANPAKPLISDEGFARFMAAQKGADLFNLGIRLYNLELNEKAALVFRSCLAQGIRRDTAAFKLGNLLVNAGKLQDGLGYLVQATTYNPTYLNAFFNLGATCYDNGLFQQSLAYYQQAEKLSLADDRIMYGMAAAQYALQQYSSSLANCKKALLLNKDNQNAKTLLQLLQGKTP